MNKMQTAAAIILQANLELLAQVHKCTVSQVTEGLRNGNAKLLQQFGDLAQAGAAEAAKLHAAGQINLV